MDHIPLPAESVLPHPTIEYLCSSEFPVSPNVNFETYPENYGLDIDADLTSADFSSLKVWQVNAFIQEWLIYVLLACVFREAGVPFKAEDFVADGKKRYEGEPEYKIVTMKNLLQHLQKWNVLANSTGERHLLTNEKQASAMRIFGLIQQAQVSMRQLMYRSDMYAPAGPFACSIICIGETLHHAVHMIYVAVLSDEQRAKATTAWPEIPWLSSRMQRNGWCPSDVLRIHHLLSMSGVYFASSLQLPPDTRSFDHTDCTMLKCNINYLDRDTYRSRHRCAHGDCSHLGPIIGEIEQMLSTGKVPVICVLSDSASDQISSQFKVISSDEMEYTAISHVWSDGRGNLTANTLPECQLQYLVSLIRAVSPDHQNGYFWMDTLCVPVGQPFRNVAIGLMKRTYEEAAQVLVLDSALESVSPQTEPEDLLIRVTCAGWMRRLWTLQEGVLARRLFFQFGGKAIELEELRSLVEDRPNEIGVRSSLTVDALVCCWSFEKAKNLQSTDLLDLIRALQWRSTSWSSDETVCLGILLNLDVQQIVETRPEERMSTFLRMLKCFPFELAFVGGPRLRQDRYGWAPQSLMPSRGISFPPRDTILMAAQTGNGLTVEATGLFLDKMGSSELGRLCIDQDPAKYIFRDLASGDDGAASWSGQKLDEPAIVCVGHLWNGLDAEYGLLVDLLYEHERMYLCKFVSCVFIAHVSEVSNQQDLDTIWPPEGGDVESSLVLSTATRAASKVWCIS
jgi:hypothetical protein